MVLHRVAGLFACHPEYCRLFHPLIGVDHINLDRRFVDIGVSGGTGCWTELKAGRASPEADGGRGYRNLAGKWGQPAGGYSWVQPAQRGLRMMGERSDSKGLWEADQLYLDHAEEDIIDGLLASLQGRLFRDADFAGFRCADNGRDIMPPNLLQAHDRVIDADCDIWWKVALGIEVEDRPFAKSTLHVFRARLILHDRVREVFESSLRLARESGYLKRRRMKVALDTTNILGRGRGEGHLQSAGGRDRQAVAGAGSLGEDQRKRMGQCPGTRAIPCLQHPGRSGHRLAGQAGAVSAAGRDRERLVTVAEIVTAGAGGVAGGQRRSSTGFVVFFWVLTLVLWVYLANNICFYRTGHIGPRELAWKGILPLVNLGLVIH